MTILMGFKLDNGVVFTADQKQSDLTANGENKGTFRLVKKIHQIHPSMILGTGGLGDLGAATSELLKSVIGVNKDITVPSAIKYVRDTFHFTYHLFKKINTDVTYLDLAAIIGGYDLEKKESYLYTISSKDDFTLNQLEGKYIRIGPGTDILDREVNENIHHWKNQRDVIKTFSSAIRKVDSADVSKSTFSIASFYDQNKGYLTSSVTMNEDGKIVKWI